VAEELAILAVGDVVGRPGRLAVDELVGALRRERGVGFVVVNAENAASGSGLTPKIVEKLLSSGVDVITTGDHVFRNKEVEKVIGSEPRLLRPANLSSRALGRGWGVFAAADGTRVGVLNLQGSLYMRSGPLNDPFEAAERAMEELLRESPVAVVDVHAEATSEKIAMGWLLDGRASLVFGTHTHVQTADERVLPKGTAYITDLGMTGARESVLGRRIDRVLEHFTTGMPSRFDVATRDVRLSGVIARVRTDTGRALSIERLSLPSAAGEGAGETAKGGA
jgi:hypothetical protein